MPILLAYRGSSEIMGIVKMYVGWTWILLNDCNAVCKSNGLILLENLERIPKRCKRCPAPQRIWVLQGTLHSAIFMSACPEGEWKDLSALIVEGSYLWNQKISNPLGDLPKILYLKNTPIKQMAVLRSGARLTRVYTCIYGSRVMASWWNLFLLSTEEYETSLMILAWNSASACQGDSQQTGCSWELTWWALCCISGLTHAW